MTWAHHALVFIASDKLGSEDAQDSQESTDLYVNIKYGEWTRMHLNVLDIALQLAHTVHSISGHDKKIMF